MKLYKKEFDREVNFSFTDSVITFEGEGYTLTFEDYHEEDCCENVYADFSVIKHYIEDINSSKIRYVEIVGVDDIGFLMNIYHGWGESVKIFIPCYNEQNGYYSDELELIIKEKITKNDTHDKVTMKIDITKFKEDRID